MSSERLNNTIELYFRTFVHTTLPLHAALVDVLCGGEKVPNDLATVLEDIGQIYMRMADDLNQELIRRGARDPAPRDIDEAKIDDFIVGMINGAGRLEFSDGTVLDAKDALGADPALFSMIRAELTARKVVKPLSET